MIESKQGVVRRVNPPVKAGPVLTPVADWECGRISIYVSVVEDPIAEGRFLMYYLADSKSVEAGWEYNPEFHLCRAISRDGIEWERLAEQALPFCSDTQNVCFYDSRLMKYVAYIRAWSPRHVKRTETDDLLTLPWPYEEDSARDRNDPKEHFNKGVWRTAKNELPTVMQRDEFDPPGTDIYTSCVQPYPYAEDVYVAFPSVYRHYDGFDPHGRDHRGELHNDGVVASQLAVSRDGIHFTRFREPYIGPGRIDEPDAGQVYMAVGMIRRGDDLYQYYAGTPFTHGMDCREGAKYAQGLPREAILRVVQRLDGFVSLDAGREGGDLTTPVLTFEGSRLQLNIDCGGMGEAWVEFQDAAGAAIRGFTMDESVSVDRNGVAQEVWWHNGPEISSLAGRPIKMRIRMRSASLFGFQFTQ